MVETRRQSAATPTVSARGRPIRARTRRTGSEEETVSPAVTPAAPARRTSQKRDEKDGSKVEALAGANDGMVPPRRWTRAQWMCALVPVLPAASIAIGCAMRAAAAAPGCVWRCVLLPDANMCNGVCSAPLILPVQVVLRTLPAAAMAMLITLKLLPMVAHKTLKRGLFGLDLNKRGTPLGSVRVPEAAGLAPGVAFLVALVLLLVQARVLGPVESLLLGEQPALAVPELLNFHAALAGIGFMLFLGFADDVLDVPWRVKLILPVFVALPLIAAYNGETAIIVPKPLQSLLSSIGGGALDRWGLLTRGSGAGSLLLELGFMYQVYMLLLTVFATNSINILAGVNGLEAGQSIVIAGAVATHNLSMIARSKPGGDGGDRAIALDPAGVHAHVFSFQLMLVFGAATLALLRFNWYPSRVFVGDTYTYFAGMTFAVAGILGHFSETLLLFFLPQVVNFIYSVPQLLKIVPCPRHRLPRLDPKTMLLHPTFADEEGAVYNMNVVTLALRVFGPCHEETLTARLMFVQAACCAAGFGLRYLLSSQGWYK